jgi:hypothetical protein
MMAMFLGVSARLGEGYLVYICFFLVEEEAMIESYDLEVFQVSFSVSALIVKKCFVVNT